MLSTKLEGQTDELRNLKHVLLSERSQCEKATCYMIQTTYVGKGKTRETVNSCQRLQEAGMDAQAGHRRVLGHS